MYIILLLTTLYLHLVHICNHENCESREAPAVNRGQFNKTFTSVIYNCSYCFRV